MIGRPGARLCGGSRSTGASARTPGAFGDAPRRCARAGSPSMPGQLPVRQTPDRPTRASPRGSAPRASPPDPPVAAGVDARVSPQAALRTYVRRSDASHRRPPGASGGSAHAGTVSVSPVSQVSPRCADQHKRPGHDLRGQVSLASRRSSWIDVESSSARRRRTGIAWVATAPRSALVKCYAEASGVREDGPHGIVGSRRRGRPTEGALAVLSSQVVQAGDGGGASDGGVGSVVVVVVEPCWQGCAAGGF
jgi:hypothetical protein